MDRLTELAPGITPYRFGFNNPNYWADPTGLFETAIAANSYMKENGLSGTVYKAGDGLYHLVTSAFDYVMTSNGDLVISVVDVGVEITVNGGGSNKPINSGGLYGGSTFFGANGFLGGNNWSGVNTLVGFSTAAASGVKFNSQLNSNYQYKYGTKTHNAKQLTELNKARMGKLAKRAGRVGTGLTLLSAGSTVVDGLANGWQNHHTADLAISGVLYVIAASNPLGWVVGSLYFVADVTIQNYTGKSITENLFD